MHSALPIGHVRDARAAAQACAAAQAVPQAPQFRASVSASTHTPPHDV